MTILRALTELYDRLDRQAAREGTTTVPSAGLKLVPIDFVLRITTEGQPVALVSRLAEGEKRGSRLLVPGTTYNPDPDNGESSWDDLSYRKRTSGRRSFVFWEKSSYVFGVCNGGVSANNVEVEISPKSIADHLAFVEAHRTLIAESTHPQLTALAKFVEQWHPDKWRDHNFSLDALDKNIAIEVSGFSGFVHDVPEARQLAWQVIASTTPHRTSLISGEQTSYSVRHPTIFGVSGTLVSGAALVSVNADAFVSYGLSGVEAAPVSELEAFKYGAALNYLLSDRRRSFRSGNTTVLLWSSEHPDAVLAEEELSSEVYTSTPAFMEMSETNHYESEQAGKVDTVQPHDVAPSENDSASANPSMNVLGLSPNAGRISVRFWIVADWGDMKRSIACFKDDISIQPPSQFDTKINTFLFETAPGGKASDIPPRLSGDVARSIFCGEPYPASLLTTIVTRIRADKKINAERAGLLRAILRRNHAQVVPLALDDDSADRAYNLGRLFASFEFAQNAVAERSVTIRHAHIGLAAAAPHRAFPLLIRGYANNGRASSRGYGRRPSAGIANAKTISDILRRCCEGMPWPTRLSLTEQARFFVGYYHQSRSY